MIKTIILERRLSNSNSFLIKLIIRYQNIKQQLYVKPTIQSGVFSNHSFIHTYNKTSVRNLVSHSSSYLIESTHTWERATKYPRRKKRKIKRAQREEKFKNKKTKSSYRETHAHTRARFHTSRRLERTIYCKV